MMLKGPLVISNSEKNEKEKTMWGCTRNLRPYVFGREISDRENSSHE